MSDLVVLGVTGQELHMLTLFVLHSSQTRVELTQPTDVLMDGVTSEEDVLGELSVAGARKYDQETRRG